MIETKNSRLNVIFTVWFLAVALIPLIFVSFLYLSSQQKQAQRDETRLLAHAAREKVSRFNSYMVYNFSTLQILAETFAPSDQRTTLDETTIRQAMTQSTLAQTLGVYLLKSDGSILFSSSDASDAAAKDFGWIATVDSTVPQYQIDTSGIMFTYPISATQLMLGYVNNADAVRQILFEDINDQQYFSRTALLGSNSDVGKTADFFLLDEQGIVQTDSLFDVGVKGSPVTSQSLLQWILKSRDNEYQGTADFGTRGTIAYARRMNVFNHSLVFVATINAAELSQRLADSQRQSILLYIFLLILVLILLYIFVGALSRFLIKPIYATITNLISSSRTMQSGIGTMNESMNIQKQVAASLLKNYKDQVKNIEIVHDEIRRIVTSLTAISKQTNIATKNVSLIDTLARESEVQAKHAEASVSNIKKLTTANDALLVSLEQYSGEIEGIAKDVRQLSQAIQYLSLNANIESAKAEASHGLASIVDQVGRLSLLSTEASGKISDLVATIQGHLQETKVSTRHESEAASQTLTVINAALERLEKMSRDAMKIAESVTSINKSVSSQATSTQEIATHSEEVTEKAQGSLKEISRLNTLVTKQVESVSNNVKVVTQTMGIVERLQKLIGAKEQTEQTNGKKKKEKKR